MTPRAELAPVHDGSGDWAVTDRGEMRYRAGILGDALPDGARFALVLAFSACAGAIPTAIFSGVAAHAKTPQHIGTTNGMVMQASQIGQFFGPIALAWLATRFGGWGATLWAMLAFAAGAAACGLAIGRIDANRAEAAQGAR